MPYKPEMGGLSLDTRESPVEQHKQLKESAFIVRFDNVTHIDALHNGPRSG